MVRPLCFCARMMERQNAKEFDGYCTLFYLSMVFIEVKGQLTSFFFYYFQVQPYNRRIGHRVWSKSLSILTELSVNSKSTIALNPWHTHSQ